MLTMLRRQPNHGDIRAGDIEMHEATGAAVTININQLGRRAERDKMIDRILVHPKKKHGSPPKLLQVHESLSVM